MLSLVTPAVAVAPLALTAAELLLPPLLIAGSTFLFPSSSTSNVPKMGRADNYGIYRHGLAKIGTAAAIGVTGYLAYDDLRGLIAPKSTQYPALSAALYKIKKDAPDSANNPMPMPAVYEGAGEGSGKYYVPTSSTGLSFTRQNGPNVPADGLCFTHATGKSCSESIQHFYVCGPDNGAGVLICRQSIRLATEAEIAAIPEAIENQPIADTVSHLNSPSLDDLYPQVLADVDKFIAANPGLLQLPSTLQTDMLNAKKQLASDAISSANNTKAQSLADVVASKQAAYDANPTQENLDALNKAKADLAEAEAVIATEDLKKAEEEEKALEEKAEEDFVLTPPSPPELLEINYQPLVDMGRDLGSKFPFSLLATLQEFATSLIAEPQTPVFQIAFPAPFNYTWTFDLSRFDGIAQFVRVLIGMSFLAYCTMFLIRRWH